MWICTNCGEHIPDTKDRCAFCDTPKNIHTDNYCINPKCISYKKELDDMRKICPECGELTSVGKKVKDML